MREIHSISFDGVLRRKINCEGRGAMNNFGSWNNEIDLDCRHDASTRNDRMNPGWMDFSWVFSWIMGFEDELNPIVRGRFNSRRVYSSKNEPGRWSLLVSHVESTAYCVNCSSWIHSHSLFISLFLARILVAPVSKRDGSFYNRIYRRTGGTTKRT